jgi:hypothetical protein
MQNKRAYHVDPYQNLITQVYVGEMFTDIQEQLKCDEFTIAYRTPLDDVMYVDDCYLIRGVKKPAFFCVLEHYTQPIGGYGLLVGTTAEGKDQHVQENILDFAMGVKWMEIL